MDINVYDFQLNFIFARFAFWKYENFKIAF